MDRSRENDKRDAYAKVYRVLSLYDTLNKGIVVNKQQAATMFAVKPKTIQRDLDDLRAYLDDEIMQGNTVNASIDYDREKRGYLLSRSGDWLTQEEVLAIAKILLESRAFSKLELNSLLDKITGQCILETRKHVTEVILNERFHYLPVGHNKLLLKTIWDISLAVRERLKVEMTYIKPGTEDSVHRIVEPCGLIFSEYYFYLLAYIDGHGHDYPIVYRLDRILSYQVTTQHFRLPEANRFEEGEFRQKVQFMRPGRLMKITFHFWGPSLEAVLDRLPTAHVVEEEGNVTIVEAEVFGSGIKMWLLSQSEFLEVLKPEDFRQEMKETVQRMLDNYKGCAL